jgi:DNA-binding transcriptional regulator YhcF (GntR family)
MPKKLGPATGRTRKRPARKDASKVPQYQTLTLDVARLYTLVPGQPIAEQIRQITLDLIERGILAPGMRMPSTEYLGAALGVSAHIAFLAYDSLLKQRVLTAQRRQGYCVGSQSAVARVLAAPHFDSAVDAGRRLHLTDVDLRAVFRTALERKAPHRGRRKTDPPAGALTPRSSSSATKKNTTAQKASRKKK